MATKIFINGFDEYARSLSEIVELDTEIVTTNNKYAYLGLDFDPEWIPKIGEWFWK